MSEMTENTINKAVLLEWLETESRDSSYESIVRDTITTVLLRVRRGTFDIATDSSEIRRLREENKYIRDKDLFLSLQNGRLQQQNSELAEVLRYYANTSNYDYDRINGTKAREVLRKYGLEEK